MNRQIKQLAINALFKVINSAPSPNYIAQSDVSDREFINWMNYVFQTLDITFNYTGAYIVISTKNMIMQLANNNIPYGNRIDQIKGQLHSLIQMMLQY
ncbi:MAG: hypothetical protein J1F64_04350 [Oscillospiraceae bacterium]|nr:hypothetical protein [Oscillospiraceae bacterium]